MKARMLEYLTSTFTVFRARMETRDCEVPSSAGELHRDRKEIAKGAFGYVFSAYLPTVGKRVAVKQVFVKAQKSNTMKFPWKKDRRRKNQQADRQLSVRRMNKKNIVRELKVWTKMNERTPYIVKLLDEINFGSEVWFVMELCDKGSLLEYTSSFERDHGYPLQMKHVKEFYAGIFLAVREMHKAGIIHRDIKPENILVGPNLIPKLSDFGQSIFKDNEEFLITRKNGFGTAYTAPPESFIPGARYNESADTFSLCLSMLASRMNKSYWEAGRSYQVVEYSSFKELYEECLKLEVEIAQKKYFLRARIIPQKLRINRSKELLERLRKSFDPTPWTPNRDLFSDFAQANMLWDVSLRPTAAMACKHPYMENMIEHWEENPCEAAENLRQMIEKYVALEKTEEEKSSTF
mmetsp:Transcript_3621/g.4826  ORF Transcript_3621/g.4826 Transcript_3621/m.4826 type:complete len:407 (+) Transcript_3621:179-1399(+)